MFARSVWANVFAALCVAACAGPPYDADATRSEARRAQGFVERLVPQDDAAEVNLVASGQIGGPPVVFIHGAPGSWEAWGRYLADSRLVDRARLIAVDRPGYGGTKAGTFEPSLARQATRVMSAAGTQTQGQPALLVGHSYGGPVALQIALDYPQAVAGLILLAPSIDPELEIIRWYQRVANWGAVRAILPASLDTANQEILPLKNELIAQQARLSTLRAPTLIVQGMDDSLVPPGNADYGARWMQNPTLIKLPGQGHFLPWEQYELVVREILARLPPGS
jgi:pimeloyl-ACP methyl ester carboxylesterase